MLSASVTLERPGLPRVALARMALVEAVGELGSISAAARKVGLSYKGAWDAIQALNNLFDAPLIAAAPGGKAGGKARVTPRGEAALAAFRRVQVEMDAALARLDQGLGADVFWSLGMKTSARNALRGRIAHVTRGAVNTEVTLRLGDGLDIVAIVTAQSVEELGLAEGAPAIALIKSSFASAPSISACTRRQAARAARPRGVRAAVPPRLPPGAASTSGASKRLFSA
jgi:molybdate transport system regulatory protein